MNLVKLVNSEMDYGRSLDNHLTKTRKQASKSLKLKKNIKYFLKVNR